RVSRLSTLRHRHEGGVGGRNVVDQVREVFAVPNRVIGSKSANRIGHSKTPFLLLFNARSPRASWPVQRRRWCCLFFGVSPFPASTFPRSRPVSPRHLVSQPWVLEGPHAFPQWAWLSTPETAWRREAL